MSRSLRRRLSTLSPAALALLTVSAVPQAEAQQRRPLEARFTTDEGFDAATIPAHRDRHEAAYQYIDAHLGEQFCVGLLFTLAQAPQH